MINEVLEVQKYLNGENIDKKCLFRICLLMAKWYKQKDYTNIQIREAIFAWGKKYNVYIDHNVNMIINKAIEDKLKLKDNIIVKISENDIEEIKHRFDTRNTRLTALAMLCYAKGYADRDNEFQMSALALGHWTGLQTSNLTGRHIKELIDFEYLEKIIHAKIYSWNKKNQSNHVRYKINVPLNNEGIYELLDNDIIELYNRIFK